MIITIEIALASLLEGPDHCSLLSSIFTRARVINGGDEAFVDALKAIGLVQLLSPVLVRADRPHRYVVILAAIECSFLDSLSLHLAQIDTESLLFFLDASVFTQIIQRSRIVQS